MNPSTIPFELYANDYFQKRNVQLIEEVQEYALLTRHLKKENGILMTKIDSLQKLVDDITRSKEHQLEEFMNTQPNLVPASPQVQVLVNASRV